MAQARRVNPSVFPKRLIIGNAKLLPEKKYKCEYHLCLEEAFGDLIIDDDVDYLNRLIADAKQNNVCINSFRSLDVDIYVEKVRLIACLYVNNNFTKVKLSIPRHSLNFLVSPDEIISYKKFQELELLSIKEKIKNIQQMLKSIYC